MTTLTTHDSHPVAEGIRARLHRAAVAGVMVITAAACLGYVVSESIASVRQRDQRLLLLSRVGALQLADISAEELTQDQIEAAPALAGDSASAGAVLFRRWASSVLTEPDVVGVGVFSADGSLRCSAGSPLDQDIASLSDRALFNGAAEQMTVRVAVSAVDLGPGRSPEMFVAAWSMRGNALLGSLARSAPLVVLMGIVGCVVGSVLLWRVDRHLSSLTLLLDASGDYPDHAVLNRLARRGDVVGGLANRIIDLIVHAEEAIQRAHRAESAAENSVEQNTRKLSAQMKKLKAEASRDALTGLANRRFIEERLTELYDDYKRRGQHVVIVMIDVDNFKPLNDNEGHAAGDEVLRFLGELLRGTIRDTDIAARYGGDEFVILLAGGDCRQASAVVSRIMQMFAQRVAAMPITTNVTLSAGMACSADFDGIEVHDLLQKSDDALYLSKRRGKNLVQAAD